MSKLYIFGIGGTGARVLKSLTMLLAAGVKLADTDAVVPVIIDADQSNGDLTRTVDLLNLYKKLRGSLTFNEDSRNTFFRTEVDDQDTNFRVPISNEVNKSFGDYIRYNQLDRANQALVSLLFSKRNLQAEMNVGFKGNPNMGSVVLNNFQSDDLGGTSMKQLMANFQEDDRIFIISSIFGGTGAAGFPLLLKTFRSAQVEDFPSAAFLQKAPIGAITVLPYFGLEDREDSSINAATFLSKAKSALTYYINNLDIDALYYIGDNLKSNYHNCEGGRYQENNAHFVELAAALSVVDFVGLKFDGTKVYKEYATKEDADPLTFPLLSEQTQQTVRLPLTQFFLFSQLYKTRINDALTYAWAKDRHYQKAMLKGEPYKTLSQIFEAFNLWLGEMAGNVRSFQPFNLKIAPHDLLQSVNGVKALSGGFLSRTFGHDKGYYALLDEMEKVAVKLPRTLSGEDYFMSVFSEATRQFINHKKI